MYKATLLLALMVPVIMVTSCVSKDKFASLEEALNQRISALPGDVTVGLALEDFGTGSRILINELEMMHAASTMKVPVMLELFRQAELGRFNMDDSILVKNSFRSIVDGSEYAMDISEDSDSASYDLVGKQTTIYDLIYRMISMSSNLATNILIELVTADSVMATLKSIGINNMLVLRGVEDMKAYNLGLNNRTNALDLMLTMSAIARDQVVTPAACAAMRRILFGQHFNKNIPAGLPDNVKVAHKTGSITKINHDAALIYLPDGRTYSLTILIRGIVEHDEASTLAADLSRMIYAGYYK